MKNWNIYRSLLIVLTTPLISASFGQVLSQDPNGTSHIVLHGTVRGEQNKSYIEVPFDVPPDIERLTVAFHYTGKSERTTLDLGIEDPKGIRGWSGGNKDSFTISSSDATPSYQPGEVVAGRWKLLIGVPNIRTQSVATYDAEISLVRKGVASTAGFTELPLRAATGWYRGDLHMHTGHSDGRCTSQGGKEVPCPVFVTVEAAAKRGLDFIAITDHNARSHYNAMRELQPYFDRVLLIPGREITTFQGHLNIYGITEFLDFRVGGEGVPEMSTVLRSAQGLGALASINHPSAPSGEICMGCGWQPKPTADTQWVSAVEAVNGGAEDGPFSGLSFWEQQLQSGHRLTGIGGSDNHRPELSPERIGSVGSPTTVVYASSLSVASILAGIRAGHVFVDLTGSHDRLLEVSAKAGDSSGTMGDVVAAPPGSNVELTIHVANCSGSSISLLLDGHPSSELPSRKIVEADQTLKLVWPSDGQRHWLRVDVRTVAVKTEEGKLQLLGNPIYVNHVVSSH